MPMTPQRRQVVDLIGNEQKACKGLKMNKDNNQNLSKEKLLAEIVPWYNWIKIRG